MRFYSGKPLSDTGMPENTVPLNPRSNVGPLNLTEQEMSELVAYLESALARAQSGSRNDRSASTSATSICAFCSLPA